MSRAILSGSVPRLTIATVADDLIGELRYLNARPRGGTEVCRLPIHRVRLAPLLRDGWRKRAKAAPAP
jgi:hypothetical protein